LIAVVSCTVSEVISVVPAAADLLLGKR